MAWALLKSALRNGFFSLQFDSLDFLIISVRLEIRKSKESSYFEGKSSLFRTYTKVGQRMKPKENVSSRLKNIMPGSKKLWEEHLFLLEKLFFLPSVEKSNHFSSRNKSSPQNFSVPGILFPARRNIYSIFLEIEIREPTFFKHNNSSVATVTTVCREY